MMRKCFSLILGGVLVLGAAPLQQGERDFALSTLHATSKLFLDSLAGLSKAQLDFKSAPDRWSIAECAEHIALSEDLLGGRARAMLKQPAEPDKAVSGEQARKKDQMILTMVADRSQKAQAPEMLQPKHKFATAAEAADHFRKSREANIEYIRTTEDDLRSHVAPHPAAGPLDSYQWLLLMSAHTERHTRQILEVKADPNFPK